MKKVIQSCKEKVQQIYSDFDASHDMQHIERVLVNAKKISATIPGANEQMIELGVLLHDIDDPKYFSNEEMTAREILESLHVEESTIQEILACIEAVSFSGGNEQALPSIEAAIMRDADRLDAIGAVGIARAFAFGGARGRKLYDLSEEPRDEMTVEAYRKKEVATVTHFREKLLKIKDLMVTEEGKRLAIKRHAFMEGYLTQLKDELS